MPVINDGVYWSCDEMLVPGEGTPFDMEGHKNYTRRFRVVVMLKGLSHIVISRAPGIPIGGTFYIGAGGMEFDTLAVLTSIKVKAEHDDDWQCWVVECLYSTKVGTLQSPDSQEHPELERPKVSWDHETIQYANWFKDRKGVFVGNSAKMPFTPPMSFPVAYPVLHIVRKELKYSEDRAQEYAYTLNDDVFLGYPKGTVQCLPPHAEQSWKGAYRFWIVTYKIRFSPIVWIPRVPKVAVKFDKADPAAWENDPAGPGFDSRFDDPKKFIPLDQNPVMFNEGGQPAPPAIPAGQGMPQQGGGVLPEAATNRPPWLIQRGPYTYYLGWQPFVLDQGMYRLPVWPPLNNPAFVGPPPKDVVDGVPVPITRAGLPISHPDLLDGSGQPVARDANGYRRPVYLGFIVYRYRSMVDLIVQGLAG